MSCCRARQPTGRALHPSRILTVCVNCRGSLRKLIRDAITTASARSTRGVHRVTVEIECPVCQYRNQVPLNWVKR